MVFDADDTLWDFSRTMWEALDRAIAAGREVAPEIAGTFDAFALQALRDELADQAEAAGTGERLADLRRRSFEVAVTSTDPADPERRQGVVEAMTDAYFAHRHGAIGLFPEVPAALAELAQRYVVGLVTNGNTDPDHQALPGIFSFRLAGDRVGIRKPDARIFAMAAAAAGCHPSDLVSVGDQPDKDVVAPQTIGSRGVWINRTGAPCPPGVEPDAIITDLTELAAVLARFDVEEHAAAGAVGVGTHPEPWPADPRLDPQLLAEGDRRNVVDRYRYWSEAAVVADLADRAHPFHVAVENWRSDHNIGAVVRNANAFGAAGVHIVGRRRWNRRGAMATDRYLPVHHHDTVEALARWAADAGLDIVGLDNVEGAVAIESVELPERCVLLFGQEGPGLSPEALAASSQVCAITQYGSTRSLNAGVASGIAMHAWVCVHVPR